MRVKGFIALAILFIASYGMGWLGKVALSNGWFDPIDRFVEPVAVSPESTGVWSVLARITEAEGVIIITLTMVGVLLLRRLYRHAGILFAGAITAVLSQNALKEWVGRARPNDVMLMDTGSFPSGQAFLSVAIYGVFAAFLIQSVRSKRARIAIGTMTVIVLSLISYGRVVLGAHYITDVIAGIVLGLVWLGTALWSAKKPARTRFEIGTDFSQGFR